jgi:hypothetical protein
MDFLKTSHDVKTYNMVHCWRVLKDYEKWKQSYASYRKSLKNGNTPATVDLEEEDGNKVTLPGWPKGPQGL